MYAAYSVSSQKIFARSEVDTSSFRATYVYISVPHVSVVDAFSAALPRQFGGQGP